MTRRELSLPCRGHRSKGRCFRDGREGRQNREGGIDVMREDVRAMVDFVDGRFVGDILAGGAGRLRRLDIRRRIQYMVENFRQIKGRPALPEDGYDIALEAVAQSYATEIAYEIGWDVKVAVLIAFRLLEEVNAHTEAAALMEAAKKMGTWTE